MTPTTPPVIQSNAINVTAYGAIGNGATDDTAAIQAAANAAAAGGLQLFFPPGVYNVSSALQMASNATWIAAAGTATLVATAGNPIITSVETQNDTASGLTLAGSTSATVPQALLIAYKTTGFTLVDATIQNTSGIGALFSDVNNTTVSETSFSNIGNNTNLALSAQGVAFTNDTAGYGSGNIVNSSSFTSIGLDAISATGQTGFSAVANTVYDATINPGWGTQAAAAAGVYGNNDTGLVVADNNIHGVSGNGVDIDNSSNVSIYQNTVSGTGSAGIALYSSVNGTISWNTAINNDVLQHFQSVGGIVVGAQNASNIEIADNVSGNTGSVTTQPYGIQIIDGQDITNSSLQIVQNNTLTGNATAAISDPNGSYASIPAANMPAISYTIPVNDALVIGGIAGTVSTTSAVSIKPFASATITDSDMGVTETLSVTVAGGDADGRLSGSGIVETATPGTYAIGAAGMTPTAAAALLQAAVFTPAAGAAPIGTSISTTLTITDVQTSPTSAATISSSAIVTLSYKVVALPISATSKTASAATTDEANALPFSGVVITDPNAGQTETAVVSLGSAANGAIFDPYQAADGGTSSGGAYVLRGAAAAVATELDNLQFRPTAHQVAPGQTVNTSVTATITDSAGQSSAFFSTISATAVNDAPVIGGVLGAETSAGTTPVSPFAGVTITDPDVGAQDSLVIALVNAAGALSDANGTLSGAGLTQTTTGVFALAAAAPAALTAELRALRFTPAPLATGQSAQTVFVLAATQNGLTDYNNAVSLTVSNGSACFASGTRIMTASRWPVVVEALSVGDEVTILGGSVEKIVWIGHRTIITNTHPRPESVYPVLITAGALGAGLPRRDLLVSPDHAMYLDGHLIPAKALTNGFSIRQVRRRTITYYHIELTRHAVLFAEGAAAESYLDTGNRAAFENGGPTIQLHPDFAQTLREQFGCAPFAEAGPAVEAVRQRLLDRAGIACTAEADLTISYKNGSAIIASRSAIPGELTADPRDRRRLGVKIAALEVDGATIPLGHAALRQGWHAPEPDGRWTNGRAVMPKALLRRGGTLTLRLAATLAYPERAQPIGKF